MAAGVAACRGERVSDPPGGGALPPTLAELAASEPAPRATPPGAEPADRLSLSLSIGVRGRVEPCGCPGAPAGGFARRATALRAAGGLHPGLLAVEGPNLLGTLGEVGTYGRGPLEGRAREVLGLLDRMGYDAFAPGVEDLELLGAAGIARAAKGTRLAVVATNLLHARTGRPPFPTHAVLAAGDRKLALLSVVAGAASSRRAGETTVLDPAEALRAEISRLPEVDAVLVAADVPGESIRSLARTVRGVDFWWVEGGAPGEPPRQRVGEAQVLRLEGGGTALARLDLLFTGEKGARFDPDTDRAVAVETLVGHEEQWARLEGAGGSSPAPRRGSGRGGAAPQATAEGARAALERQIGVLRGRLGAGTAPRHAFGFRIGPLDPSLPEAPAVRAELDALRSVLLAGISPPAPPPGAAAYAGVDACLTCHAPAFARWSASGHATAFQRILEREQGDDPACLGCHTTGWAEPGGFVMPEQGRHLLGVQCEACHGPATGHPSRPVAFREPGADTCRRCHDAANSPGYDAARYLEAIRHW